MTLPKDLVLYKRKRILMHVIPCAALVCAFLAILLLFGKTIFNTEIKEFRISCYIIVMLIPFAVTGVPRKLIDSTYYGTIKKVDIITSTDSSSRTKVTRECLYMKNTVYLLIETSSGKTVYKKACSGKVQTGESINKYREGDLVFHLYGTSTVIVLPDASDTAVQCAVCGDTNKTDECVCHSCGHSLVKNI